MASPSKPKSKRRRRSTVATRSPSPKPPPPDMDSLLESVLASLASTDSFTASAALNCSFDRKLDSLPCNSGKIDVIQRAMMFGALLIEAAKHSARKVAAMHNMDVWYLPPEITVNVFSMLDSQSVCFAAATCSFFRKCAEDSVCYTDIDLTCDNQKVDDAVVVTMLQRAGTLLRSFKLGPVTHPISFAGPLQQLVNAGVSLNDARIRQVEESSALSCNCLTSLRAPRPLLKRLHLYNTKWVDNLALKIALSSAPGLIDIVIVGLRLVSARQTLESVSSCCPLVEHLFFESCVTGGDDGSLKLSTCSDLVRNCPNISFLALRGLSLHDYHAREFVKGFRQLKYVDFSVSYSMTGAFLKGLGGSAGGSQLEVIVLCDCVHLKIVEVTRFLSTVLAGHFKHLKYLDISNREGLASEGSLRCFTSSFIPLDQLREVRPELCVVAEFPAYGSQHSLFMCDETTSSDSVAAASTSDSDAQSLAVYFFSSDSDSSN